MSLFRSVLGEKFDALPAPIKALHEITLPHRFEGRAIVHAADGLIARTIARMSGLPGTSVETDIAVEIERDGDGEIWTRHFPPRPMRTRLWREGEVLHERLGPIELRFRLEADTNGIVWHPLSATSAGTPAPDAFLRGIRARESVRDGRYHFDVGATLPWIGRVVAYDGWLHVD